MNFVNELVDVGRRATVDVLSGGGIERDSPFSPDVPEDLRQWLPDLFDRFPVVFPWSKPQPVDPALHTVWIWDNAAFRSPKQGEDRPGLGKIKDASHADATVIDQSGIKQPAREESGWEAEFVASFFIKNSGKDEARVVAQIAKLLNVGDEDVTTKKRIAKRLQPFLDTVLPNRTLRINIDGQEEQTLGPSNLSGISQDIHQLHFEPSVPGLLQSSAENLPPPFSISGTTVVADETGWGIISDIDDTIKITQTPSPLGILRSTFLVEEPEPIRGMPELYAQIASAFNHPPFFYLSASPYNLYPFLKRFRDKHFPTGMMILRNASWQNLGGLITSLQQNTQAYKTSRIEKIHSWYPYRQFVCIGDSTQADPESYGEVARKFPGWIKAIYIHKVTGIAEMNVNDKDSDERFEKAFSGLDRGLWHVYTDASELKERVDALAHETEE